MPTAGVPARAGVGTVGWRRRDAPNYCGVGVNIQSLEARKVHFYHHHLQRDALWWDQLITINKDFISDWNKSSKWAIVSVSFRNGENMNIPAGIRNNPTGCLSSTLAQAYQSENIAANVNVTSQGRTSSWRVMIFFFALPVFFLLLFLLAIAAQFRISRS